jgi:hypothetical protein
MKGLLAALLTGLLVIGLLGCGANRMQTRTSLLNGTPLSISGFVSTVQLSQAATSQGGNSLVTVVSFIPQSPQMSPVNNLTFCGNVVSEFVLNTFATVSFTSGAGCATIVSLTPMSFVSLSGFVSIIQLTSAGTGSPITMVTFLLPGPQTGLAETIAFCGNVGNQFALNGFMNVSFTQGESCASVIAATGM